MASHRNITTWSLAKALAGEILRQRQERRRVMAWLLVVDLGLMVGGLWMIGHWLAENLWRFLLWWGACATVTGVMFLFSLFDMLAVIREERERLKPPAEPDAGRK